jgi:hypothetical protein
MKYWEIIADNLSKAGWSWGCVATVDSRGRTIWIVDAHRDNGKRFVVHAGEKLTAFMELASAAAIQPSAAALEAGLMEQEQHYLCSAVLP